MEHRLKIILNNEVKNKLSKYHAIIVAGYGLSILGTQFKSWRLFRVGRGDEGVDIGNKNWKENPYQVEGGTRHSISSTSPTNIHFCDSAHPKVGDYLAYRVNTPQRLFIYLFFRIGIGKKKVRKKLWIVRLRHFFYLKIIPLNILASFFLTNLSTQMFFLVLFFSIS